MGQRYGVPFPTRPQLRKPPSLPQSPTAVHTELQGNATAPTLVPPQSTHTETNSDRTSDLPEVKTESNMADCPFPCLSSGVRWIDISPSADGETRDLPDVASDAGVFPDAHAQADHVTAAAYHDDHVTFDSPYMDDCSRIFGDLSDTDDEKNLEDLQAQVLDLSQKHGQPDPDVAESVLDLSVKTTEKPSAAANAFSRHQLTSGLSSSGFSSSGLSTSGFSTSGLSTSGFSTSGFSTSGLATSGLSTGISHPGNLPTCAGFQDGDARLPEYATTSGLEQPRPILNAHSQKAECDQRVERSNGKVVLIFPPPESLALESEKSPNGSKSPLSQKKKRALKRLGANQQLPVQPQPVAPPPAPVLPSVAGVTTPLKRLHAMLSWGFVTSDTGAPGQGPPGRGAAVSPSIPRPEPQREGARLPGKGVSPSGKGAAPQRNTPASSLFFLAKPNVWGDSVQFDATPIRSGSTRGRGGHSSQLVHRRRPRRAPSCAAHLKKSLGSLETEPPAKIRRQLPVNGGTRSEQDPDVLAVLQAEVLSNWVKLQEQKASMRSPAPGPCTPVPGPHAQGPSSPGPFTVGPCAPGPSPGSSSTRANGLFVIHSLIEKEFALVSA